MGPHGEKVEQLAGAALGWWVGNFWVKAVLLLSEQFWLFCHLVLVVAKDYSCLIPVLFHLLLAGYW